MLHAIAEELGCDPELVGVAGRGLRKRADITKAARAYIKATAGDEPKRERKASLTLSQRRALVKLQAEPQNPATAFKAQPYDHLVQVGYATRQGDGSFVLTDEGRARAESINPLYVVWSAGESVAGDPERPAAGTKRAQATAEAESEATA